MPNPVRHVQERVQEYLEADDLSFVAAPTAIVTKACRAPSWTRL
jgi:hypothetical protein